MHVDHIVVYGMNQTGEIRSTRWRPWWRQVMSAGRGSRIGARAAAAAAGAWRGGPTGAGGFGWRPCARAPDHAPTDAQRATGML